MTDTYLGLQWITSKTLHVILIGVFLNDLEQPWVTWQNVF